MKVDSEVVKSPPEFEPIVLTITLESLEEAAKFYSFFGHTYILDAINGQHCHDYNAEKIRRAIDTKCPEVAVPAAAIHNRLRQVLTYKNWSS
jgi:hypothetical protein